MGTGAQDSQAPLAAAAVQALAGAGLLALGVLREGRLRWMSARLAQLLGLPGEEAADQAPFLDRVAPQDRTRVLAALDTADGQPISFDGLRSGGGRFEAELVCLRAPLPGGEGTVLLVTDATERRRAEAQLSYLAFLDPLTGLPNRTLHLDRLRDTVRQARRDGRAFALLACDLDGFKQANDTLGHEAGDAVLREAGRRLAACVRAADTVARTGGDEFAVILARLAAHEDAALVAERMVRAFDAPVVTPAGACKVGVSIGLAAWPQDGEDVDGLLARADAALYASKRAGKGRFTWAALAGAGAPPTHLPFLVWTEAMEVGHASIDEQHRRIVDLVNRVGDDLKNGRERDALVGSLGALVEFTRHHFATEEKLMARLDAPHHVARHRAEHQRLLEEVRALSVRLDGQSVVLTMRFLNDWLVRHVEELDRPLAVALSGREP